MFVKILRQIQVRLQSIIDLCCLLLRHYRTTLAHNNNHPLWPNQSVIVDRCKIWKIGNRNIAKGKDGDGKN